MVRRRFLLDVESTSTLDLTRAGADAYWSHPQTQIICACYRVDDRPIFVWRPGDPIPYDVPSLDAGWRVVAHNWLFEYACWTHQLAPRHGWPRPPAQLWDCTMARCLYWGLPASLVDAGGALGLPVVKDASARALMLRMARPRSYQPLMWWHDTDPAKLTQLIDYCRRDVEAETYLDEAVPALPDRERKIFQIDGRINRRGICIDVPLVERLSEIIVDEGIRLNRRIARATLNAVQATTQTQRLSNWARDTHNVVLANLAKDTLGSVLADPTAALPPPVHEALSCRLEAAKASTAKLVAMQLGLSRDGRCKGLFQYGGAGRTLRWASRRVQFQNLPRGGLKFPDSVFSLVRSGAAVEDIDALVPGTVMDIVAAMLRGCAVPAPGKLFVSGDLAQIEARVVAWLAYQWDILRVFRAGEDVYTYTAAKIGSASRLLGKVLVLACGFGMGGARFQATAAGYGIDMSLSSATDAVYAWRDNNERIVLLWNAVDEVVRQLADAPSRTERAVGRLLFAKRGRALRITLPSSRVLTYHNIALTPDEDGFGTELTYMGVNSRTKRWEQLRTYGAKLVENCTQAIARDILAEALIERDELCAEIIGTVHDELLEEAPALAARKTLDGLLAALTRPRAWTDGLPIAAEGWIGDRYKKT